MTASTIFMIILAYLLGSLSSAILIAKGMGWEDPRESGSGNPGATNMLRIAGKKAAAFTLFGDALKGFSPVLLARFLGLDDMALCWVAIAAVIGHLFPIFFAFRGGKGVATAMGVLLVLSWQTALAVFAVWVIVIKLCRISSLGSLIAACSTPLVGWWIAPEFIWAYLIIVLLILLRHYSNIMRLIQGKEAKSHSKVP